MLDKLHILAIHRVFKYRPANKHTLDLLRNQNVHFSFPDEFNDPFDCKVSIDWSGSDNDVVRWAGRQKLVEKQKALSGGLSWRNLPANHPIKFVLEKGLDRQTMIYCVAGSPVNNLMWSHYAASHTGVCIGFRTEIHNGALCILFDDESLRSLGSLYMGGYLPTAPVRYALGRPKPYSVFRGNYRDIKPFLVTKSREWKYEKERRILLPAGEGLQQTIKVSTSSIAEIYLGAKIGSSFKKKVLSAVRLRYVRRGFNVKVFQMHFSNTEYRLVPLDERI